MYKCELFKYLKTIYLNSNKKINSLYLYNKYWHHFVWFYSIKMKISQIFIIYIYLIFWKIFYFKAWTIWIVIVLSNFDELKTTLNNSIKSNISFLLCIKLYMSYYFYFFILLLLMLKIENIKNTILISSILNMRTKIDD